MNSDSFKNIIKSYIFNMNEMHAEPPFPYDYITSRNGYCKPIMISMAESKHVFKNHKLHQKGRWSYNVISAFSRFGVYIYIYIYIYIYNFFKYPVRWQKLPGSARSGSTTLRYRNCVITPGWWLMRTEYRTCFHTLYDEIYIYIYIYIWRGFGIK